MDNQNEECKVIIGATVPSGFEFVAKDECFEKFGTEAAEQRGRILFPVKITDLEKVKKLRAVDNIYAIVAQYPDIDLQQDKEEALNLLCRKALEADWKLALLAWKSFTSNESRISLDHATMDVISKVTSQKLEQSLDNVVENTVESIPTKTSEHNLESATPSIGENQSPVDVPVPKKLKTENLPDNLPSFRVTCNRVGKNHQFGSPDAACKVGGIINDAFHWPVKMKNFDIEVLLNIIENTASLGISLTKESLFRRNITRFGPTTLRANICYSMLRLSKPQPGEIICDPMCGGGSILLEGSLAWPNTFSLGGDNHGVAIRSARQNMEGVSNRGIPMDVMRWDCTNLPLRHNSVDIIISDLPFGKRIGRKVTNWELYYRSLVKMARVAHPQRGRAVLLTQDKKCMSQTLQKLTHLWSKGKQVHINLGGLSACVYVLYCVKGRKQHANGEAKVNKETETTS